MDKQEELKRSGKGEYPRTSVERDLKVRFNGEGMLPLVNYINEDLSFDDYSALEGRDAFDKASNLRKKWAKLDLHHEAVSAGLVSAGDRRYEAKSDEAHWLWPVPDKGQGPKGEGGPAGAPVKRDGGGLRYNKGKIRYDLLHPTALKGIAGVMTKGAEKYAERNWERGMSWTSVLASAKRHIAAFEAGEDYDPETGLLHIDHAQCGFHFLSAFYKIYPQGDDRRHKWMDTPKIGLDIDEVLCDWVGDWTDMRGITERPTSWYFDRGLVEEFEKMKKENKLDEFYLSLRPLIKPEEIPFEPHCYITSRPVDTAVTEQWLAKHGFPARPVFTTGVGNSKVDIAKREGVEVFVDDGFHNFKDLNEAGVTCFLMDAPHNRRYEVGYRRIKNLKELM